MKSGDKGLSGLLRNAALIWSLGLFILGGANQSYAQESKPEASVSQKNYNSDSKMRRSPEEFKRYEIESKRLEGKIAIDEDDTWRVNLIHPRHGVVIFENLSDYVSKMTSYIKDSQEKMQSGVSILESELQRGFLSPDKAKEAKQVLEGTVQSYEMFQAMYGYIHYSGNNSRFKREVDFFAPDIREELVDSFTGARIPYPAAMARDFANFARKFHLNPETNQGYGNNPYQGEIGKPLQHALEELDEAIKENVQKEIKTRRYVPWSGFGERIDEFVHPDIGDICEGFIALGAGILLLGGIGAYLALRSHKKEQRKQKEEGNPKPKQDLAEPPAEIIDPWEINLSEDQRRGGNKG